LANCISRLVRKKPLIVLGDIAIGWFGTFRRLANLLRYLEEIERPALSDGAW
jgi:hypothetical protein